MVGSWIWLSYLNSRGSEDLRGSSVRRGFHGEPRRVHRIGESGQQTGVRHEDRGELGGSEGGELDEADDHGEERTERGCQPLCGTRNVTAKEAGDMIRAHCIEGKTKVGTTRETNPAGRGSKSAEGERAEEGEEDTSSDSDSEEAGEGEESVAEEVRDQREKKRARQVTLPSDTGGETRDEKEVQVTHTKRVRMSSSTEVETLVPRSVSPQDSIDILFKSKKVAEAADFEHSEEEEGPGAMRAKVTRAGLEIRRLREACGEGWPATSRLKDIECVYEWREPVIDAVTRAGKRQQQQTPATRQLASPATQWLEGRRDMTPALTSTPAGGDTGALITQHAGESVRGRVLSAGAAPLPVEAQPGAVSADVAERLHEAARAGQIQTASGGDVGSGIRMVPEELQADLARAVGSNGRVDAAGEFFADRVSLPRTV